MQTDIASLRPGARQIDLAFKVVEKQPVREVTSKMDGSTHKVCDVVVGDSTGTVVLTLWDDKINLVEEGKTYELKNGYTSTFQNHLRLNTGRYGEITQVDRDITVNTDNDMSAKEHENPYRRRASYGGRRY